MSESYNIFLSWSGPRAKAMAEALQPWLRRVIQSARPFFSDKIETGAFWDDSVRASIQSVRFAVICCTPENVSAPWINYEAGAIAERLKGRTAPWLLGSKPAGLKDSPLSRLMAREADEAGTLELIRALNASLEAAVDEAILVETFETHWPKLKAKLEAIPAPEARAPERSEKDMLEEVVGLCRQIAADRSQASIAGSQQALDAIGLGDFRSKVFRRAAIALLESQGGRQNERVDAGATTSKIYLAADVATDEFQKLVANIVYGIAYAEKLLGFDVEAASAKALKAIAAHVSRNGGITPVDVEKLAANTVG
jgi:hypothetical protein